MKAFAILVLTGLFAVSAAVAQEATPAVEDTTIIQTEPVETPMDAVDYPADPVDAQTHVSVEFVLNEAPDDLPVTLHGRLVEALGDDFYIFEDETGVINVKIGEDTLDPDQFVAGVEVEISGEVDRDDGEATAIDVEEVRTI